MRIAAISYYYHPIINGVVLTIDDWRKAARAAGHTSIILASHHPAEKREEGVYRFPSISLVSKFGISIPWFPGMFVLRTLRETKSEIIHVHHPFFLGALALLAGRRSGIPVVFTYHTRYDTYIKSYLPFLPDRWVAGFVNRYVVAFMNRCTGVTVALPSLKQELVGRGVTSPVTVVPIGVATKRFAQGDGTRVRHELGLKPDALLLISVARIAKEKNVFFMLDVAARILRAMPDAHFCWIGKGPEENEIYRRIRRLGLADRMHMLQVRSYKDIPDYYAAGGAFLSASTSETFGRVFTEAMSAGLPVFVAQTPTIDDVITNGTSGIILPTTSAEEFARGALSVLKDPARMRALGEAGAARARAKFDIAVSWSTLEKLYRRLLRP
jgi:glycosyltransferase involved in cell wall biosynthesis